MAQSDSNLQPKEHPLTVSLDNGQRHWSPLTTCMHEQTEDLFFLNLRGPSGTKEILSLDCENGREKKEENWLSPMTKAPTPAEMSKGQSDNTNNVTKKARLHSGFGPT